MKAILIDPILATITTVEIESWRDIAPALGCDLFTTVRIDEENTLYVDDCGLIKFASMIETIENIGMFSVDCYDQKLAGKGLFLGNDFEGASKDTTLTREKIASMVRVARLP